MRFLAVALVALAALVPQLIGGNLAHAGTISFASGTDWEVFDADPDGPGPANSLGNAQNVCLNASAPSNCPPGATLYGYPYISWTADLSSIPGATWIWAPGIDGGTSPADFQEFFFRKQFDLAGTPTAAALSIAVDNLAEVRVNGVSAGTYGSITDCSSAAFISVQVFDIAPLLVPGANTLTIRAQNGPPECAGCSPACSYAANPAGVVFGGSIQLGTEPAWIIRDDATGGDCSSIGTWNVESKTCALSMDLGGPIQMESSGITLNGNGRTLTGPSGGNGVTFDGETNVTIRNLTIRNCFRGISGANSANNAIEGNTVLESQIGIQLGNTTATRLRNNTLSGNSGMGIYLLSNSNDNLVTGNTTSNGSYGIYLSDSDNNIITNNNISNNSLYGVVLTDLPLNNQVYHNNFVDNDGEPQASVEGGAGNVFSLPAPTGGNYWDNWTAPDNNHDGFVDQPQALPGAADFLPHVRPIPRPTVIAPVDGAFDITSYVGPPCSGTKWCFDQWGAPDGVCTEEYTHGPCAICGADDTWAWDANLNTPQWDEDDGKWVYAVAEGTVDAYNCENPGDYGQVLIEHGNGTWWSGYLHMDPIVVSPGQTVHAGTPLGRISNKSPDQIPNHLHFVTYTGSNTRNGLVSFDAELVPNLGHSSLTAPAPAGTIDLHILDMLPFRLADRIRINPGMPTEEDRTVIGFASVVVDSPLQFNHGAGEPVVIIDTSPPAVGGIAELPDIARTPAAGSGSPARNYIALAVGLAVAVFALAAGACYVRRRRIKKT